MGETPFGSSARLSGDLERSTIERERERERLEGICNLVVVNVADRSFEFRATIVDGYLNMILFGIGICHYRSQWRRTPF